MRSSGRATRKRLRAYALVGLVVVIAALATTASAFAAAPDPQAGPLDAQFVRYQKQQLFMPWRTPAPDTTLANSEGGLVPAPVDFGSAGSINLRAVVYPSSFDLRASGQVTAIRDQGQLNNCWAFAALASLESTLLPDATNDFSEDDIAVGARFDFGLYGGGNEAMAAAYLSYWKGPVNEADDPYGDGVSPAGLAARYHVQNVFMLPDRAGALDNDTIKWALTNHGAVFTAMRWGSGGAFKSSTDAFYYSGTGASDHAVAIVGWDDAYSKLNFPTMPSGNGAFLVRNSWGDTWGDGGYFWISYYDTQVGTDLAVFTAEPTTNYSGIYQYDRFGLTMPIGYSDPTAWMANAFKARGDERLRAVGFYAQAPNTTYQIYLGSSLGSRTLLDSGTIVVPGYRTIVLPTPRSLSRGATFYVIVKITTPNNDWPVPVEGVEAGYSSAASSSAYQSFVSPDGTNGSWTDMGRSGSGYKSNVCLKAYTEPAAPDLTPPMTTVSGMPAGWAPGSVKATFKAADSGGAGVNYSEYSIDGGGLVQGSVATVTGNGLHTLAYRSTDMVGNVEADNSVEVRIDTRHPVTKAPLASSVAYHAYTRLYYRVNDALPNGGSASMTIKIKTLGGRTLKTFALGNKTVNSDRSLRYHAGLRRGTYRFFVYARDAAGNAQSSVGYNKLVIR